MVRGAANGPRTFVNPDETPAPGINAPVTGWWLSRRHGCDREDCTISRETPMSAMPGLLASVLGKRSRFYPFETSAIDAVIARIDHESGAQLRRQVEAINKVQRLVGGKEVNLYQMRRGKPAFDDRLRFAGVKDDEVLLARVGMVRPGEGRARLKVDLWLVRGRLFSLLFNQRPRDFFNGAPLHKVVALIDDVRVWFDPAEPPTFRTQGSVVALHGWLRDWHAKGLLGNLQIPFRPEDGPPGLMPIDAVLPRDYLDLLSQTDGATVGDLVVHGVKAIREIATEDSNYYILAETAHRGLGVRAESDDGEIYVLDYEEDSILPAGRSLKTAIEKMIP